MKCSNCKQERELPFTDCGVPICEHCYRLDVLTRRIKALESHKPTAGPWPVHYYKDCYGGTPPAAGCDCTKDEQAECERDRKTILPPPLSEPDQRLLDAVAVAERLTTENEKLKAEIDTFRARLPHPPFDSRRLEPSKLSKALNEKIEAYRRDHPTFPPQWGMVNGDSTFGSDNADLKSEIRTLTEKLELREKVMRKIDAEQSDEHTQLAQALGIMTSVPKHAAMVRQVSRMRSENKELKAEIVCLRTKPAAPAVPISDEAIASIMEALEKYCQNHPEAGIAGNELAALEAENEKLRAENARLKARLDAAPKCPSWGHCTEKGDLQIVEGGVLLTPAEYVRLKAAAKRHRIECWREEMRYIMRFDGGESYRLHRPFFDSLGRLIMGYTTALNLDIIELPQAPEALPPAGAGTIPTAQPAPAPHTETKL